MKRKICYLFAFLLALGLLTACQEETTIEESTEEETGVEASIEESADTQSSQEAILEDGTYTATKESYQREHVTVSVRIEANEIKEVTIDEITDHPLNLTSAPVKQIPEDIVTHQTYNVDTVTGATFTSTAIKQAVKDCLDQAGGAEAFSESVPKAEPVDKEDIETDILVIGGGGAGMTSAIEASMGNTYNESSGFSVTLIEKAGFLGGNTSLSGGVRYNYDDPNGKYDEAWINEMYEIETAAIAEHMELDFNEGLIKNQIGAMKRTNDLFNHLGVESVDNWGYLAFAPSDDHMEPKWNGSYLAHVLIPYLAESDIDVKLNTQAMELIVDDNNSVVGVKVQDPEGSYSIYAKKVILATGGFAHNKELIEEYAPEFVDSLIFSMGTNTGDGLVMAKEAGAEIIGDKMFGHIGADAVEGARPDYSLPFYYGENKAMYINLEGERFVKEDKSNYIIYHDVLKQKAQTAWGIVDSNNPDIQVLIDSTSEYVVSGDSIEELASKLEIPHETMQSTIDTYNQYVENGEDLDYGTSIERMDAVDEGPYYAFILRPIAFSSMVGVKVDGDCRVLHTNGDVIENLFATGDLIVGGNVLTYYFDARGVGTAVYSGNLAAQTAKEELLINQE